MDDSFSHANVPPLANRGLLRRLWLLFLWLIVIFCLLSLSLQLALPWLATPARVTKLVSHYVGSDIEIGYMRLSKSHWELRGAMENVAVMSKSGAWPQLEIKQVLFNCNPWLSIVKAKLNCSEVTAYNVTIRTTVNDDGIASLSSAPAVTLRHLSGISSLHISKVNIMLPIAGTQEWLHVPELDIRQHYRILDGLAQVELPQQYGNSKVQLRFIIKPQFLRPPELQMHLSSNSIDLASVGRLLPEPLAAIATGASGKLQNLDILATWSESNLSRLTATSGANLKLQRDGRKLAVHARKLSLNLDLDLGLLAANTGSIAINGEIWSGSKIIHATHKDNKQRLWWPQQQPLNVEALRQLLFWWQEEELPDFGADITLDKTVLTLDDWQPTMVSIIQSQDLANADVATDGVGGVLSYSNERLRLDITNGNVLKLFFPNTFKPDLIINQPRGTIHLWQDDGELGVAGDIVVVIENAHGKVRGADMTYSALLLVRDSDSYYGDMIVSSRNGESIIDIIDFLPYAMNQKLRDALPGIIPAGKIDKATMVFRGDFINYPFPDKDGTFQAELDLRDLAVVPNTDLHKLTAKHSNLFFDNETMRATLKNGKWYNLDIEQTNLLVPDMTADGSMMQVKVVLAGDLTNIMQLGLWGLDNAQESIDINLVQAGNGIAEALVEIHNLDTNPSIQLQGASIEIIDGVIAGGRWDSLKDINGTVELRDNVVAGKQITATWLGQAATIAIQSHPPKAGDTTTRKMEMNTVLDKKLLQAIPELAHLAAHVEGQAELSMQLQQYSSGSTVVINTDLAGLEIKLPAPFGKAASNKSDLQLHANGNNLRGSWAGVQLDYTSEESNPAIINIDGEITDFSASAWQAFTQSLPHDADAENKLSPIRIHSDLQFATLELFGQHYLDATMTLRPGNDGGWRLALAGDGISAEALIPELWLENTWQINIDQMHFKADDDETGKQEPPSAATGVNPNHIPAVALQIKNLYRGEKLIGSFSLSTEHYNQGQRITDIHLDGQVQITGTGEWWRNANGEDHTSIELNIQSRKMAFIGQLFQTDMNIEKATTNVDVALSWLGSPADFSIQRTSGNIHLEINKGSLDNVQSQSGRFLSLFSLSTIIDRLSLDFSALTSPDIEFNGIYGVLTANNGVLSTTDMTIDGASMFIHVTGDLDLRNDMLNHKVVVVPKLSGSMALLGLAGGLPGIGIGTAVMLFSKITNTQGGDLFGNIVRTEYKVSGSIDDPKVTEITAELPQ